MPRGKATGKKSSKVLETKPSQPKRAGRPPKVSKTSETNTAKTASKTTKSTSTSRRSPAKTPKSTRKTNKTLEKTVISTELTQSTPEPTPEIQEPVNQIDFDVNRIMDFEEFQVAVAAKVSQITLGNNIITSANITLTHDITINLNGFSIISEEIMAGARVIDIRSGAVTITGPGKIFAMGSRSVAVRVFGAISSGSPKYTHLTVGEGVCLFAPDAYGVLVSPNLGVAYGVVVDFAGEIIARDGICLASGVRGYDQNLPTLNLADTAKIVADEATGVALDASGHGIWHVHAAKLRGAIGTLMRTGKLEFHNTQIMASFGAVFQISDGPDQTLNIDVNGGSYIAENEDVILGETTAIKKFSVKDCDFCSASDHITDDIADILTVKNVNFRSDIDQVIQELTAPVEAPAEIDAEPQPPAEPEAELEVEEMTEEELLASFADGADDINDTEYVEDADLAESQIAEAFNDEDIIEKQLEDAFNEENFDLALEEFFEDHDIEMAEAELEALQPEKKRKKSAAKTAKTAKAAQKPLKTLEIPESKVIENHKVSDSCKAPKVHETPTPPALPIAAGTVVVKATKVTAAGAETIIDMDLGRKAEDLLDSAQKIEGSMELADEWQNDISVESQISLAEHQNPATSDLDFEEHHDTPIFAEDSAELLASEPIDDTDTPELVMPELTDDDADEHEIMHELTTENASTSTKTALSIPSQPNVIPIIPPQPPFAIPPEPIQLVSEQDTARVALMDALADIRKLRAEDYEVGFSALERAITRAESVLASPLAKLTDIRDAASELLAAFDRLEERTEMSLSDAELDDLFYHGAVLAEVAQPTRNAEPVVATNTANPENVFIEPDFTMLNDVLATISELDLSDYSENSQVNLLNTLDYAQNVLLDTHAPQSAIDEISTKLVADMAKLDPVRPLHSARPNVQMNSLAPVVNQILPATMVDEMAPMTIWSQGVTMLDEQEPVVLDVATRERILRAMRPWVVGIAELATDPFRKVAKSVKAGVCAGINTYRETLRAAKS